jgi:hypothetical protein
MEMKKGDYAAFANPGSDQGPGSMGLTKREYFAGLAMQGMVTNPEIMQAVTASQLIDGTASERIAKVSIQYADELLKQLEGHLN